MNIKRVLFFRPNCGSIVNLAGDWLVVLWPTPHVSTAFFSLSVVACARGTRKRATTCSRSWDTLTRQVRGGVVGTYTHIHTCPVVVAVYSRQKKQENSSNHACTTITCCVATCFWVILILLYLLCEYTGIHITSPCFIVRVARFGCASQALSGVGMPLRLAGQQRSSTRAYIPIHAVDKCTVCCYAHNVSTCCSVVCWMHV